VDTKRLHALYSAEMPEFLTEAANTEAMQRLKQVGMNCGCEYTSFPRFKNIEQYSRFDHSVGAALVVWHFTRDKAQALSGLFHDISTPTFAHVIDFLLGDHMTQEATENDTAKVIENSRELCKILADYGISTDGVSDYHRYPVADNDSPRLSADRLEYSLGNMLNYGIRGFEEIESYYRDLTLMENEDGEEEIAFKSLCIAADFAKGALECSKIYVSDEDRYSMQILAELVGDAVKCGVLNKADLNGTEPELIKKLCADEAFSRRWQSFCGMSRMSVSHVDKGGAWRKIFAKKRFINPLIAGQGRLTELCEDYKAQLDGFISASQDYWIMGE